MTDQGTDDNVVLLRPVAEPEPPGDTLPPRAPPPAEEPGKRRALVPEHLQPPNLRTTAGQAGGLLAYRTAFHGLRLPWLIVMTCWYALVGAAALTGRLLKWWHWTEGWLLESQAVAAGRSGHHEAIDAHMKGRKTRKARGQILAVCLVGLALAAVIAVHYLPPWAWPLLGLVAVIVLARVGKPDGKPLVKAAVTPPKYAPPTPEIITRALGSLGISGINEVIRTGRPLAFVTDVHRDGEGWGIDLDLPHGVTPAMILQRRPQFASGLRRPLSATWPEPVPDVHEGRLRIWIGFTDISQVKAKPWPLLKAGQADVFSLVPFGTDPRGRNVGAPLFEVNWLIGAAPGQGKTATVRELACAAALDPLADLWIHELAGKGDLHPLAQVCHRYTSGLDDEAVEYAAASIRLLRTELERRAAAFKKLTIADKPEGKLTRELAARKALKLRPLVCFIDECQNLFMHPEWGSKAQDDAAYVIRLGRAYGIILVLSTQRPDKESLPTSISGVVTARFCLQVPDQVANDMIMGTGAYKAGYNAVEFRPKTDAGMGWLKAGENPQVVRTYYLDLKDTQRIAARARVMREQAGVLSGYALGEDSAEDARDFLGDVLSVFGGDANLWSETIASRLAERLAGSYAGITQDAVASQLRDAEVTVKPVREAGKGTRSGCSRADVEAVRGV